MARLHSIKAKGYNDEDLTRINDVAKALGTIDVQDIDDFFVVMAEALDFYKIKLKK